MLPKEILTEAREVLGSKLRAIREKRNLSIGQLAERVGCSTGTINRIESGRFFPHLEQLLSILHQLDSCLFFAENDSIETINDELLKVLKKQQ